MAEVQQPLAPVGLPKVKLPEPDAAIALKPAGNAAGSSAPGSPIKTRLIMIAIAVAAVLAGGRMWWRSHYFEETENAYLEGNVSLVSPRVAGTVTRMLAKDNQRVRAGDLLVELDRADHQIKVDQIQAQILEIEARIKQVDAQTEQSQAETASAEAHVARAAAQSNRAHADALRYTSMYTEDMRAISRQELDAALATRDSTASEWRAEKEQVLAVKAKTASIFSAKATLLAQKKILLVQLQDAHLQLGYNSIRAPVDGRIGRKNVEVGARVQPGQQILAIVQDGVWVTANFKETQLAGLAPAQQVSIRIDAIPGAHFTGRVDSFSPASGAHFSLLPPDNATGNFTKITQRIPVKILIAPDALTQFSDRLAPGMSAVVEIDLRQGQPEGKPTGVAAR
jgi:membrane fusion protein, multidrug efflux system